MLTPYRNLSLVLFFFWVNSASATDSSNEHFEKRVRPLLAEHCWKCHGSEQQEAGLRLDTRAGIQRGGDSGKVILTDTPDESLLLRAVQQTADLKMPPDSKLTRQQIADLRQWIVEGAAWPAGDSPTQTPAPLLATSPLKPNAPQLVDALQLWLQADALQTENESPVFVWPDQSGHGRDLTITQGVRPSCVGTAPQFVLVSRLNRRPAVRFQTGNGLASSPDLPLDIHGDGAATIIVVCQLAPGHGNPRYDNLLTIGNPAAPTNPGHPRAFYLEVDRSTSMHSLDFAGGWGHDANGGPGSAELLYEAPHVLTVSKKPGPMTTGTSIFLESQPLQRLLGHPVTGSAATPDVQHRNDFGVSIGKTLPMFGSIQGDIGEIIIYNRVLSDEERQGVEAHLVSKYDFLTADMFAQATREFSAVEKAHWSFQPIRAPALPAITNTNWSTHPLDRFVLAKLEASGLQPAPPADRLTLIRRATYDLLGLPPTPEQIETFVSDPQATPAAFMTLIQRLLDSPHYGERWARHWLDVVRYADTTANDGNFVMRYAFRYRDYVLNAFNQDKPYDQFVIEQLAGDLLPPDDDPAVTAQRIIATGFLMIGPKALAETDKEQVKMDIVDEQLDVVGRSMLGLTIACARCHDHKFDPIPTVDYYSLAGIFRSTEVFSDLVRNASKWMEYSIPTGPDEPMLEVMATRDGVPRNLRVHLRGNRFRLGQIAPRRYLQLLAGAGHSQLSRESSGRLALARWIASPTHPLTARVMVNRIWQGHFGRGLVATSDNFGQRGQLPSHPELLDWLANHFIESNWSVKAMHRLMLSSQTYQMSTQPHPTTAAQALGSDPENRLLWKSLRQRLDAEQLRDSLLAIAGALDTQIGGGELISKLYETSEILDKDRGVASAATINSSWEGFDSLRRSLYLPVVRNGLPDGLALFDAADPNNVTSVRNETTVSSQAAFLLNNPFVLQQARTFAQRVMDAEPEEKARVQTAYTLAIGRPATEPEVSTAISYLANYRELLGKTTNETPPPESELELWTSYCQLLFCLNEFLYVE